MSKMSCSPPHSASSRATLSRSARFPWHWQANSWPIVTHSNAAAQTRPPVEQVYSPIRLAPPRSTYQ
eukprot:scaffold149_cov315-Pinguiococcus_pyrenoidosus.AAC.107